MSKVMGIYVKFWHFYDARSPNMAMSRDQKANFENNLLFPNFAFNIRKSYKICSRKALYFVNRFQLVLGLQPTRKILIHNSRQVRQ